MLIKKTKMLGYESLPYHTQEKLRKIASTIGAVAVLGVGGSVLAVEGYASAHGQVQGNMETPIERTLDQYPNVINESPMAGDEQIATAGEWKSAHPDVRRIVIEDVEEHYGHDPQGNAAEEAQSQVKVTFSNGRVVEMPGFGEQSYGATGATSLDKKITNFSEKIGMIGGNASVENAAINQSIDDALSGSLDSQAAGK